MKIPALLTSTDRDDSDALVVVAPFPLAQATSVQGLPPRVREAVERTLAADTALAQSATAAAAVLACPEAPGGRVVLAPMSDFRDEVDDVRIVAETTLAAVTRAIQAGARRPRVIVQTPNDVRFTRAREVAALAALGAAWEPLETREAKEARESRPPSRLDAVFVEGLTAASRAWAEAVEAGRWLARDFTTAGPERFAPLKAAEFTEAAFRETNVQVRVHRDVAEWPLIAAVARASSVVERHRPTVIRLEYTPDSGPITRTLLLAGKGVTYDTGGADVKTGGGMAGMSRDKGGAGSVVGLMKTLSELKPAGLRVVALLGMVRNSVGEEAFVSDEIITARSGVRVRVGNTDAEGRLVLADLLSSLKDEARSAPNPTLVSLATLTGHVYRAFGPYVGALENEAARASGFLSRLMAAGERVGEPFESTRPRREDYLFCAPKTSAEDVLSSNRLASVDTPRGHQGPFAFMDIVSGLRRSGLPFAHLDISGVVVTPPDWQGGRPTGSPIAAVAQTFAD